MAYTPDFTAFAQSVYLAIKNRYFDDIAGTDGQDFIAQIVDQGNQYLDELETIVDAYGQPVAWNFMRKPSYNLGTATIGLNEVDLPANVLRLIASIRRPVTITVAGKVISSWTVVSPDQFDTTITDKYVTQIGDSLIFNQVFTAAENTGAIAGDVTLSLTRFTDANDDTLAVVKPKQLLVLGVAKNVVLPDIVQGGLTPSFIQKYNDLLTQAILFNSATATADRVDRENFGFVSGVGF